MHNHFKLNDKSFQNFDQLIDYSKEISFELFLFLSEWFDSSSFIKVKTSGSTGEPKIIQIKKKQMINSAEATGLFFDLQEETVALVCLPIKYIAGKMMLVRALTLGWHIDFVDSSSNPLEFIEKKYNFSAMVPLQLYNSLDKISLIDKLIVGGGVVSKGLKNKIQSKPTKIFATYGMTETITHIAAKPLNIAAGLDKNNNFFKVLPNVKISRDTRNCLVINAPKVANKDVITNDLVEVISNTEFRWLGRFDNVINSGGIKMIPEQIEEKLYKTILQRFFISSKPDKIYGEEVVLFVEGNKDSNLKSKISNLKSLNKYEIPKKIYFIDKFIDTETGKIHRKKTINLLI